MFQYKTRGNASPQGKQKVYFTCHPDDFDRYFGKISDQILGHENCAVWYWDSGENYQDIETDLGGMKLFVIPVTTKLLTQACRTMDIDLPYALKRHIPVLPLMQENGLDDELFNEKFGTLHYFNEYARDDTATPYEEKLRRYLDSVIVGDELAQKVRAAFDAYIFLSYRKKDRKYAQELMRLIHKNDFCRDIAIWYDEFLTPGENFNSAIEDALKKSELFALVVTPNLVNEENYVHITEYPMARDAEKKMLPAEMVATDRQRLSEMYAGIPECIDPQNGVRLSEALLDSLQCIARTENDSDPQHNFFIGLAYLNGIDVEIDTGRAKALIISAAEAGLNEAAEKLVSMYQNGDGVEIDYIEAIKWQSAIVERNKMNYEATQDKDCAAEYIIVLRNYAQLLKNANMDEESMASHLQRSKVCEEVVTLFPDSFYFQRDLLEAYSAVSGIFINESKFDIAIEYIQKAQKLSNLLDEAEGGLANAYNTASLTVLMGRAYLGKKDYVKAKENFLNGVRHTQRALYRTMAVRVNDDSFLNGNEPLIAQDVEWVMIHLIVNCWMDLGDIELNEGNIDKAKNFFHDAERSLLGYTAGAANLILAESSLYLFSRLIDLYIREENQKQIFYYCDIVLQICSTAKEDVWYPSMLKLGITLLSKIEKVYKEHSLAEQKKATTKQKAELLEFLLLQTDMPSYAVDYGIVCAKYASYEKDNGNDRIAFEYYQMALSAFRRYSTRISGDILNEHLFHLYMDMADVCISCDYFTVGRELLQNAYDICKNELVDDTASKSVDIYDRLFELYKKQNNIDTALRYIFCACDLCHNILKAYDSLKDKRNLSCLYEKISAVYFEQSDRRQAKHFAMLSAKLSQEIFDKQKTPQSYDDLLHGCLCILYVSEGDNDNAIWINLALQLLRAYIDDCFKSFKNDRPYALESIFSGLEAIEGFVDKEAYDDRFKMIAHYGRLSDLCSYLGDCENGLLAYQKIAVLSEGLLPFRNAPDVYSSLIYACKSMGKIYFGSGDCKMAVDCYLSAHKYATDYNEKFRSDSTLWSLGETCSGLGDVYFALKDYQKSEEYYTESVNYFKTIIAEYGSLDAKHNCIVNCINVAKVYQSMKQPDTSLFWYEETLKFIEADRQVMAEFPRLRAIVLEKIGDAYRDSQANMAYSCYERAMCVFEEEYQIRPSIQGLLDIEIITERLAEYYVLTNDIDNAVAYYLRLEKIQTEIMQSEKNLKNLKKIINITSILSELYRKKGDDFLSLQFCIKLKGYYDMILKQEQSEENILKLAITVYKIGLYKKEKNSLEYALQLFTTLHRHSTENEMYSQTIAEIKNVLNEFANPPALLGKIE